MTKLLIKGSGLVDRMYRKESAGFGMLAVLIFETASQFETMPIRVTFMGNRWLERMHPALGGVEPDALKNDRKSA
jgi:hypothetical protein